MISQEKWMILIPLQKLPKNLGDLAKLIAAKGFKKLPNVEKIAKSGHTGDGRWLLDSFGRADTCTTSGPRFETSRRQNLYWKDENKGKEAGNCPLKT